MKVPLCVLIGCPWLAVLAWWMRPVRWPKFTKKDCEKRREILR